MQKLNRNDTSIPVKNQSESVQDHIETGMHKLQT